MTAENVTYIDPGLAAWQHVTRAQGMISREQMRSALHYAASHTVNDPDWFGPTRREIVRHGAVSVQFLYDFEPRWERMLDAVRSGFGPRIMSALDELVSPPKAVAS